MSSRHIAGVAWTIVVLALALLPASALAEPGEGGGPATMRVAAERPQTVDLTATVAPSSAFEALRRQDATVRVIVGLQARFTPEGALGAEAVKQQRAQIDALRDRLVASLAGTKHRVVNAFKTVPSVALELDRDALDSLERSGRAASLVEDELSEPDLAQSTNTVGGVGGTGGADGQGASLVAWAYSAVSYQHLFQAVPGGPLAPGDRTTGIAGARRGYESGMGTVVRIAHYLGCGLLIVGGGFAALIFGALVLFDDRTDVRITAAVLTLIAVAMVYGGVRWRPRRRETPGHPDTSGDAFQRLQRGEAIVLYPRRRRWALLLVGSAVLFVSSALMLLGGVYVVGIAGTLLFGAGLLASITALVPRWAHLRIAPDGLVLRHVGRTTRWPWNDVENFKGYEVHHQYGSVKQVGFDRRDLTPDRQSFMDTLKRGMAGVDHALPDTYGLGHHELADLLNAARERYATEHGPSPSMRADLELERQAAAVRQDRIPLVTAAVAIVCVAVFAMGVDLEAGGASRDALAEGKWWTVLSANVLHVHVFHLLLNMVGLLVIGVLLEREIGWPRMSVLCVVGGVVSMSTGILLQQGAGVVGVSGIVYAIAAYALVRDVHRTRGLGFVAWSMVPVGLVYTFLMPRVSIGGHLGGLIAGFALAYLFERALGAAPRAGARVVIRAP